MINLQEALLTDILPDIFSDAAKTKAFALAERSVRQIICTYAAKVMLYKNLSGLDEPVLDLMAAELKTQYYSSELSREKKVRLISSTMRWHMLAGTRTAVDELVQSVFETDGVKEWFEYGGDPFYFKINTDMDFTDDLLSGFRDMVKKVKNTAATLDQVVLNKKIGLPLQTCSGVIAGEAITIRSKKEGTDVKI